MNSLSSMPIRNEYFWKSILKYLLIHITSSNAKKCFDSTLNTLAKWFDFEWIPTVNQMSNSKDG